MVTITCDNCGAAKDQSRRSPEWIQGYDIGAESPKAVSRSIRFLDRWDPARVLELGAIHFCSAQCRDEYIGRARVAV